MNEFKVGDQLVLEVKQAKNGCTGCFFKESDFSDCYTLCYNSNCLSQIFVRVDQNKSIQTPKKEIDWEQRRYEIAKDVLGYIYLHNGNNPVHSLIDDAFKASLYAEALVNRLKEIETNE